MSDIKLTSVPLDDLFVNKRGNSKYTKKYCNSHNGNYEVYTGTTIGCFGKIDTYDYDSPNLTYTTDGEYAGTVKLIKDNKYNIGGHRAILISKDKNLYLEYFHYILEPILKGVIKDGSVPSITWNLIKSIEVLVPTKNGEYDIEEQKKIANNLNSLEQKRIKLLEYKEKLDNSYITFTLSNYKYAEKDLSEVFKFERGGSCTKAFCNANKGEYPVYSANNIIPLSYINTYQYSGRYITLSRNGIAGKITIHDGKFTVNEDRFVLIPKVENIDYDFIKYTLEPILRGYKKGRIGHNGQNEFTKLSFTILNKVKIMIPVNEDGSYDLEAQKNIAKKYSKIQEVKQGISKSINQLVEAKISLR